MLLAEKLFGVIRIILSAGTADIIFAPSTPATTPKAPVESQGTAVAL